jgi:hypothetical protein
LSIINLKSVVLMACIVLAVYAPAFNNGFISDDYVILDRLSILKHNPLYLFSIPPDSFRYTSYLAFAALKSLFGYRPECFYAFTVLVHAANTLMLAALLQRMGASASVSFLGALLFACIQNPQEGVMWLAGMNEALLGSFMLATLLAWLGRRYYLATVLYLLALFSKESAVALIGLVPLAEYCRDGTVRFHRRHFYLLVPALAALSLYFYSRHANELLTQHYVLGPHGIVVELNSLHRLAFPWVYLALLIPLARRLPVTRVALLAPAAWMILALAPYVFLTYQNHVPSRNQYVACMGLAWLLAVLVGKFPRGRIRSAFVAVFVLSNAAYIWLVKDAQYEERAAPTSQLAAELRLHQPGRVLVLDFPLNPWIAKDTAWAVPGWHPSLITVNALRGDCPSCRVLSWDARARHYLTVR